MSTSPRTCAQCGKPIWAKSKSGLCRSHAMAARWQDEDFRRRNREAVQANWQDEDFRRRNREAVQANWQDEDFRRRNREAVQGVLSSLSESERADYDTLKTNRYSRDETLTAIGRGDLIEGGAA